MSKHTPGPWSVPHFADDDVKCNCGYVFSEFQDHMGSICSISFANSSETEACEIEEAKANARLIAAAPDLLEVAQKLVAYEQAMDGGRDVDAMFYYAEASELARAAIAKAEGRE